MRSSRVRGRRRFSSEYSASRQAWISLGFLVLALVMVLLLKERLADGAAGCYADLTTWQAAEGEPEEAPNVEVRL